MDKKDFLSTIPYSDKVLLSNIYDKILLSSKTGKTIFTNEFYPMVVWKTINNFGSRFDTDIRVSGVFVEAERRMLAFTDDTIINYPIKLLKIKSKSKFETLEHKDYLGSIMSLGVRREKFGDLILKDNFCLVPVAEDIYEFIITSLEKVKRSPCTIEIIEETDNIEVTTNFEEKIIMVTSMRLDCVIGSLCGLSRSKTEDIIREKKVLLDASEVVEKDKVVKNDIILTVRGYGKFKIIESAGTTSKGRIKLIVKKYI